VRPEGGFTFPGNAELRLPFYPYNRHDDTFLSSAFANLTTHPRSKEHSDGVALQQGRSFYGLLNRTSYAGEGQSEW